MRKILDLIDFDSITSLLEDFYKISGLPVSILDLEGNVLSSSEWQIICNDFHRTHPEICKRCTESDTILANHNKSKEKYHFYKCLNGLIDVVVPISVNDIHIANLYSGQFLFEEPDFDYFIRQAAEFGFDEKKYLAALEQVPIVSEKKMKVVMDFLLKITLQISEMTMHKIEQENLIEQIKESEQKFRLIFENAPIMLGVINESGNYQEVNKAVREILGYSEEFLKGNNAFDYIHEDDRQKVAESFANAVKNGSGEAVFRFKNVDGEYHTINSGAARIPDTNSFILFSDDITERKQTDDALKKSEARLITAQRIANIGDFTWDIETGKVTWSLGMHELLGYGQSEKIDYEKINAEIHHPDDLERITSWLNECLNSGKSDHSSNEYRLVKKDGKIIDVQTTVSVKFNDGKPSEMIGTVQDITERKQFVKTLQDRNTYIEKIMENLPIGFAVNTIDDGAVKFINSPFEEIYGWSKDILTNVSIFFEKVFPDPDLRKEMRDKIIEDMESGDPERMRWNDLKIVTSDGEVRYVYAYNIPLPDQNLMISTVQDFTERKLAENELIEAKEMAEKANRLKTEFLQNMSHEIRTPMNGIIGFSKLINEPDFTPERRKYFTQIIENSSKQLLKIIDDILEISVLETKQIKLTESEFCLNDIIMELFSIYSIKSNEREIPLYIKKDLQDSNCLITTDKDKLKKILSNLLDNAFKYTYEGCIEFGYYLKDKKIILYVKDTGIGISKKNHQTIFDRFSQEDKEISHKKGGLGLGLSISKENVQLLGGDITLESEKGQGSTFFITLPYKPASQIKAEAGKSASVNTSTLEDLTILVAEDEEVNYLYIETLFELNKDYNIKIIHAKNGKEAVEFCREIKHIELVLMDIKMPVMNGLEATKLIKSQFPDLPVIAQTAYTTESEIKMAFEHGCNAFISKPIKKDELFKLLYKYVK